MFDDEFENGDLVVIKGDPYVVWRVVATSWSTGSPQAVLRPVYWSASIEPAKELHRKLHHLRYVTEMEAIAISCR